MEREPAVAGRFYPHEEGALEEAVASYVGPVCSEESALVAMVPHAGYLYSGAIAGSVYRGVRVPSVAVVLSPNHFGEGARAAIMSSGSWRIPGRSVAVDRLVGEELRGLALLTEDASAHAKEHGVEVQLPFLMHRNPRTRVVPVCLENMPYEACVRIGSALADVVIRHARDVLIVCSTDMSHYVPASDVRAYDQPALDAIERIDPEQLYRSASSSETSMCGLTPMTVALVAAQALGAHHSEVTEYGHSGIASGDLAHVVGYAGVIIR